MPELKKCRINSKNIFLSSEKDNYIPENVSAQIQQYLEDIEGNFLA